MNNSYNVNLCRIGIGHLGTVLSKLRSAWDFSAARLTPMYKLGETGLEAMLALLTPAPKQLSTLKLTGTFVAKAERVLPVLISLVMDGWSAGC